MKKLLEELWYSYLIEEHSEQNTEKKKIIELLFRNEEKLCKSLNEEQKETFEKYVDCSNEISDISAREAFIKGVNFATCFLIEALYGD